MKNLALQEALEQIDADSWEELCRAVPVDLAGQMKLSVERQADVVMTHCLVADAPLGNRAIALGMRKPCTREQILWLAERFVATGMQNFALQISPHAKPAALEQWLREAGLVVRGFHVKLVRDNAPLREQPQCVVRLVAQQDAALFGTVSARGFERPPIVGGWMSATVGFPKWRHYLAYDGEEAIGAAAMYIDGPYAWLGIGSTVPEHRRKGVQQSLIAQRLADGLTLGVKYFIAETASFNTSCDNLMAAGFTCAYERPNYGIVVSNGPAFHPEIQ